MLLDLSIRELHEGFVQKKFSIVDVVSECYATVEKFQGKLNAFISIVDRGTALKEARAKDISFSESSPLLYGIPFVLKDSYVSCAVRTTCASRVLGDFTSPYNATVLQKLLDKGAVLIGKMNMDAWGHGATSENTDFGSVHNPWNLDRVAGGSSGGCGAAIADTGGSIRNPAAWCSISGMKVSYGRVSRYGCIAYASSFDTVGPMAKTAEDCAVVLQSIAGNDPYDATSSPHSVPDYISTLTSKSIKGVRIGVPKELFGEGLGKEIRDAVLKTRDVFVNMGVEIKEVSMSLLDYGIPVYYLIGLSETSSNLARYDGVRYGNGRPYFSDETMRRIMIGTHALSTGYYDQYYRKAQRVRTMFIREYEKMLSECDVVLMPVTPTHATKIGELISDPLQNLLVDVYTVSQNPVGIPSLAIPCGFSSDGLPIGMQLVGKIFTEDLLFTLGHTYQQQTQWHTLKAPLLRS
ncbi:MAG: Glutamyl-tRNA(Gln) amidotransferase subunit A [Parcubacteria group bacterium GW2011_GWF2_46_8]|nr:MAG: Glutamyl-tRNA(Gln) amidotransferase subunit A [Parcubacteria group bacterium GW2011_GWF2_46_8]